MLGGVVVGQGCIVAGSGCVVTGERDCGFTRVSRSQPARIGAVGAPRPDATLQAVELRRQGPPKQPLDIKADLTIDAAPFPLDSLLRCEAANPERRSHHGPRRR